MHSPFSTPEPPEATATATPVPGVGGGGGGGEGGSSGSSQVHLSSGPWSSKQWMESSLHIPTCPPSAWLPLLPSPGDTPAADSSDSTKAQGRLLLFILCSVGFSAACILLCCWACLASCLSPNLSNSRPLAPGPLHFSGYSRVPDGKPLVRGPYCSCAMVSSSGQMLGSYLGTQINRAECMLCMNQVPTVD
uniref:Uncharacterized protein n=1 Tax=Myotis myotis TaxID=51298 RepID=A0A7J7SRF4_MYOMY|nr:hypothetical protein mMyoMyo1_009371 [Myotis myotis]